jgi:recombination protein RecA
MMTKDIDMKALELAKASLAKQFGRNAIIHGEADIEDVEVISTNNFELDLALGVGGLPKGRITEVFGGEGLGKTLIALNCAANCQKEGGLVAYIDVECDLNPEWATKLGVSIKDMIIAQPSSGEEALIIAETLIKTGTIDLLVFDSVAAMTPLAEIEGEMTDLQVGAQARMMAKGLRKLRHPIKDTNTCVIFINQIRDKIGFMANGGTTTPGGRALKFYSSVRIELKKLGDLKDSNGESIGTKIKAVILKNKVGNPMKTVEWENIHGQGFNNFGAILKMAIKYEIITKSGAWYYKGYGDTKESTAFAQGEQKAIEYLASDLKFAEELKNQVLAAYKKVK